MAAKGRRRKTTEPALTDVLAGPLRDALEQQNDFIVTFEKSDEGTCLVHILTGHLITPCMRGTLFNRCDLPDRLENRHRVVQQV